MFSLANGTPKKKGRKKLTVDTDDESLEEDSDREFAAETTVQRERVERARRVAATKVKYDFSDEDGKSSSDDEPEFFENKDALNVETDKPKIVDMSSDSEVEKPPKQSETSEDLFDSLFGMCYFYFLFFLCILFVLYSC